MENLLSKLCNLLDREIALYELLVHIEEKKANILSLNAGILKDQTLGNAHKEMQSLEKVIYEQEHMLEDRMRLEKERTHVMSQLAKALGLENIYLRDIAHDAGIPQETQAILQKKSDTLCEIVTILSGKVNANRTILQDGFELFHSLRQLLSQSQDNHLTYVQDDEPTNNNSKPIFFDTNC